MGIGKLGKKLIKTGKRVVATLGEPGKDVTRAVFDKAIAALQSELKSAERGAAVRKGKSRSPVKALATTRPNPAPTRPAGATARPRAGSQAKKQARVRAQARAAHQSEGQGEAPPVG
jgi:hypothetical protein